MIPISVHSLAARTGENMETVKSWGIVTVLAAAVIPLAGCGGGGGEGEKDETPPAINNATVAPAGLRFPGGDVTITAHVADAAGVEWARATVTRPDQSTETVVLAENGNGSYHGTFAAPANIRNDGGAAPYTVHLRARDQAGNATPSPGVAAGTFQVNAPGPPPGQPDF